MDSIYSHKNSYGYQESFSRGYLIGRVEAVIDVIRQLEKGEWEEDFAEPSGKRPNLKIPEEYYNEIVSIINKYPTYSLSHLAEKVIFEASYLLND